MYNTTPIGREREREKEMSTRAGRMGDKQQLEYNGDLDFWGVTRLCRVGESVNGYENNKRHNTHGDTTG